MTQPISQNTNRSTLPQEVSASLLDSENFDFMEELLVKVGVKDPDVSSLGSETYFLALGEREPSAYVEGIAKEYGIDELASRKVAQAVVAQVLAPHREVLDGRIFEALEEQGGSSVDPGLPPAVATSNEAMAGRQNDRSLRHSERSEESRAHVHGGPSVDGELPQDDNVAAIVKEICSSEAFRFEDPAMRVRCEKLVESRVRDVRTPEQTRASLERTPDKGGLGLAGRQLADVLQAIESRVAAVQERLEASAQESRAPKMSTSPPKDVLAKKEETLMTKRYVELTGKVPDAHIAPTSPAVTRTSVALSAHHEQQVREGKIDAQKVRAAVQNTQATPPRLVHKPGMQDIVFTKRLIGPVDELRTLTLEDFRRLSKDPTQAAMKIKDKVELLEDQGADKKAKAIEAWRGSPLNQQYVALTREAVLSAMSVMELLAKKRAAGELTLTDEELKAVMRVNDELRF